MSNNSTKILGKKEHTTLEGVKRLIVGEILKAEFSKQRPGKPYEALALYFEGTMGMGKSQSVQQAREDLSNILGEEFGLIDIRLAGMTGSDIQGIPVPITQDGETFLKWLKDTLLPGIAKTCKKKGILFLDELNQVEDNSVKSLLYQLILDKKINDYVMPEGWYIVAAGNREEDGGVYNRLPAPVRDRMMIVEVDLSRDEWLDLYARPFGVHLSVVSFIESNDAGYLHTYDPEKEMDGDEECENYVFATPRSWVMVSDQVYAFEDPQINIRIGYGNYGFLTTEEDLRVKFGALLGKDMGNKFYNFYIQTRDCNVQEIYSINWDSGYPSKNIQLSPEQLVYLSTLASYPTDENVDKAIKIILYLISQGAPSTSITLALKSFTEHQVKALNDFCILNHCQSYITQLDELSVKFRNIRAAQA